MSVTRSYNKHNNTTYAYETRYEWSDKAQKKVQVRRCIGKIDPVTDKIIPTGKRGRVPSVHANLADNGTASPSFSYDQLSSTLKSVIANLKVIENSVSEMAEEIQTLNSAVQAAQTFTTGQSK